MYDCWFSKRIHIVQTIDDKLNGLKPNILIHSYANYKQVISSSKLSDRKRSISIGLDKGVDKCYATIFQYDTEPINAVHSTLSSASNMLQGINLPLILRSSSLPNCETIFDVAYDKAYMREANQASSFISYLPEEGGGDE